MAWEELTQPGIRLGKGKIVCPQAARGRCEMAILLVLFFSIKLFLIVHNIVSCTPCSRVACQNKHVLKKNEVPFVSLKFFGLEIWRAYQAKGK